jgi:acetyl esterase/lipase
MRRAAVGGVAVVVLYFGVGGMLLAFVIGWLLTPGNIDWSGGWPQPEDPFVIGYRGDPLQAFGYEFSDVMIPTELGPAPAWLVPAGADPSPLWAIYVHGIGGLRENGYRQLSVLHEAGIPTLMITYRNDEGAPAAPDRLFSFGLSEWHDLDAAVEWTLEQGAERVVIAAESMGGGIAGQFLMQSERTDAVAALALDAPALDFPAVITGNANGLGVPAVAGLEAVAFGVSALFRPDLTKAVSVKAVEQFPGPVFLAHGSTDRLVPVAISDKVADARSGPTTYLRTKADHLLSWHEDPARYRAELLGFLEEVEQAPDQSF